MTEAAQESQTQQVSNKEMNFRALQAKYERELEQERAEKLEAQRIAKEALARASIEDEDETDIVDKRRLDKRLSSFEQRMEEKIDKKAEEKARYLLEKQKQEDWLKRNPDFYDTLKHADKFAAYDPELADTILQMPDTFERQKLVYKNIKALRIDQPAIKEPTVQEKIDANRRSAYYQPSSIGAPAYTTQSDFSPAGQKSAFEKMQELKSRLRL